MDPNANLAEQECILMRSPGRLRPLVADRDRFLDLRDALDGWINAGGFMPDWDEYPLASAHYRAVGIAPSIHTR